MLSKFLAAFPADKDTIDLIAGDNLKAFVNKSLGVKVPREIQQLWSLLRSGYYGDRSIYIFGDRSAPEGRDTFAEWNGKDFWKHIYPPATEGGPVFFAETCFGDQIGFCWEQDECVYMLFCIDTFEAFTLSKGDGTLFQTALTERESVIDEDRLEIVRNRLGPLRLGMHYAPILSPILGGTGEAANFAFETPNVHFRTSLATFQTAFRKD